MILLEGMLLVPPERGSLIGRAVWKPRYVVLGSSSPFKAQAALAEAAKSPGKLRSSKASLVDVTQADDNSELYISIYKSKGDWDTLAQFPISTFDVSQIRLVQHRKQGPSLPTLMLEYKVDSPTDRQRKRRSSRTAGLGSKDPWANTLLFRDAPDERHTIHDWNARIKPHLTPGVRERDREQSVSASAFTDDGTTSPGGLSTTSFTNPFSQRDSRAVSNSTTTSTSRPEYQRGATSTYPHAPRDRPTALISPSPSLRSRRSDLSSQASSHHPQTGFSPHMQQQQQHQSYTSNVPSDLPSPASTSGYDAQFVEGWTAAQGRSSALSSHTRGSNSMASVVPPPIIGSTPPGPRETILDRAFQMRYIPGSERLPGKDEEKISSIARFEALMREADERKRQRSMLHQEAPMKSSFDLDEESEESGVESAEDDDDEDDGLNILAMRSPAQRALDYISGKTTPLSSSRPLSPASTTTRSPPIPFLNRSITDYHEKHAYSRPYRPQTSQMTTSSTTTLANPSRRPSSLATSRSISSTAIPGLSHDWPHPPLPDASASIALDHPRRRSAAAGAGAGAGANPTSAGSTTSSKRLSFQEFAKRLSSTSSLLLVQTNASTSPSASSEDEGDFGAERTGERDRAGRPCRGVFTGSEGGFL